MPTHRAISNKEEHYSQISLSIFIQKQRKKAGQSNTVQSKQALQTEPLRLNLKFEDQRFLQDVENIEVKVHNEYRNKSSQVQSSFRAFQTPCTVRERTPLNTRRFLGRRFNVF